MGAGHGSCGVCGCCCTSGCTSVSKFSHPSHSQSTLLAPQVLPEYIPLHAMAKVSAWILRGSAPLSGAPPGIPPAFPTWGGGAALDFKLK